MCLDTIKVRMQLSRRARAPGAKKRGFWLTGKQIVQKETPLGLYKGLGAVVTGIVPKMAIRFSSFEAYKQLLANDSGHVSGQATFLGECRYFSSSNFPQCSSRHSGLFSSFLLCALGLTHIEMSREDCSTEDCP
jgi:hypothetical protein